jgi:DNA-binding NtrC family response regulator
MMASAPKLETLAEVKRKHIQHVLEQTGGNKTEAAKILGIDRRTLIRLGFKRQGARRSS